ncbi:benzoylformate decarboxylase [Roseibium album]|uniref:benzoylformate decarboxylase n=1 Tax=Roseibium album TaxID=311410 RepID=UPI00391DA1F9
MNVRDVSRELMRELGLKKVFGNPGSTEIPFLQDWPDDFDYVLGLQELSVVGMADGYAQASGEAVFVNLHSAAGVGHAMGGIYTAYLNQTPMIITAGQQSRDLLLRRPFLGSMEATELPKPYVKWSCEPARPQDVPLALLKAHTIAMQHPRGPVLVSIPMDDWNCPADMPQLLHRSDEHAPPVQAVENVVSALTRTENPSLVLGPGVARSGARRAAIKLAEHLGATVYTAPMASRSVFDETHYLFAGHLPAAPRTLLQELKKHDASIVIGAPAFAFHVSGDLSAFGKMPTVFQFDDNPDAVASAFGVQSTMCSPRLAIEALLQQTSPGKHRKKEPRPAPQTTTGSRFSADCVLETLNAFLPENAALVEEAPSHKNAFRTFVPDTLHREYFAMSSGGLGFAVPAAAGIALSKKFDRVVAIVGDGSAMYSPQALWTIAQRDLPVTILILNNRGYGAMRAFSELFQSGKVPGIEIDGIDFACLATSQGMTAQVARDTASLENALVQAFERKGPMLIEARVDQTIEALYDLD